MLEVEGFDMLLHFCHHGAPIMLCRKRLTSRVAPSESGRVVFDNVADDGALVHELLRDAAVSVMLLHRDCIVQVG